MWRKRVTWWEKGAVHVVDEGIEDLGGGREGEDVVVGKTGGDEGGVALVKKNFFTGL